MKPIFNRTLTSMFKPVLMIIYFLLTIIAAILVAISNNFDNVEKIAIEVQRVQISETFILLTFIWICGITLMLLIMAMGSGLFATEESEGTMRILLAKPVTRESVIFGKILGLITGSFIYMITSLILSVTIFSVITRIDKDVLSTLLNMIPSFIIYGLLIIIFFCGIASMLSSLFKKRIPAIILLIVFVLLTFGIFPIVRNITASYGTYEKYKLYLIDTNYHIGSVYTSVLEGSGKLKISPTGEQSIGAFTGMYVYGVQDSDLTNQGDYFYMPMKKNTLMSSTIVFILYGIISIGSYVLCYIRMKKKDIT